MPIAVHSDDMGGYEQPIATGGVLQIDAPNFVNGPIPPTIQASGNWQSGVIYGMGFKNISVGITMDHAGTLIIQRYIDRAATVVQGAASSTAIVANTPLAVNITDGLPWMTCTIRVNNAVGGTGTISAFAVLLNAQ